MNLQEISPEKIKLTFNKPCPQFKNLIRALLLQHSQKFIFNNFTFNTYTSIQPIDLFKHKIQSIPVNYLSDIFHLRATGPIHITSKLLNEDLSNIYIMELKDNEEIDVTFQSINYSGPCVAPNFSITQVNEKNLIIEILNEQFTFSDFEIILTDIKELIKTFL